MHEPVRSNKETSGEVDAKERIVSSFFSQDVFRMQGARAERYLYLFEKVLLIGKRREDGLISIKTHISVSRAVSSSRVLWPRVTRTSARRGCSQ